MSIDELLTKLRLARVNLRLEGDELRVSAPRGALDSDLRDQLASNKASIISALDSARRATRVSAPPIKRLPPRREYPASFAQERLWFIDQLEPGNAFLNMPMAIRLQGELNVTALENSLHTIVLRHQTLRTRFIPRDGRPVQVIDEESRFGLMQEDLGEVRAELREQELNSRIRQEAMQPFDLAHDSLVRAKLLRLAEHDHVLLFTMHHICSDGWSMGVLFRELGSCYAAFTAGRQPELPELPVQYADFASWQREWLSDEVLEFQLDYWRQQLDGLNVLELPTDRPRAPVQTFNGASVLHALPQEIGSELEIFSQREGVSLFIAMLAAFVVLLHRYSGQEDIILGSPIANRNNSELEGLIGFFVNNLVLRSDVSGNPDFRELVQRVNRVVLGAFDHQDLPFEKLVDEIQPDRSLSQNPLIQVMFALQNMNTDRLELPGLTLETIGSDIRLARFDIEVNVWKRGDDFSLFVVYNTDLFDESTINRLFSHYELFLKEMVAAPETRIDDVVMLDGPEYRRLVRDWNQTATEYPREQTVQAQFQERASATPDATALVDEARTLSYRDLNEQANRLAHYLIAAGIETDMPVVVIMERTPELVIAQLAVLKAGAGYVAVDPDYPVQRIAFILEDTRAPFLLTQTSLVEQVKGYQGRILCLDSDSDRLAQQDERNPAVAVDADNLAYIIYTSGSTGNPKGVEVTHGGLINLVSWHRRAYEVEAADRATHLAGLGFDATVWELWPYLASGASIYLVSDERRLSAAGLWQWMAAQGITLSFLPTPLAEAALREPVPDDLSLRVLLTGGDRLHGGLVGKPPPFRLVNHYGPTENTVVTTCTEIDPCSAEDPPIGRPIDNVQTYILDKGLQPVPVGVWGELFIGGDSLARGYLNQPELTAEKFIPNPFSQAAGARMYRSGDLVRYREDGQIEFRGRVDHQVKLRGFRIELGEIESVLRRQAGVEAAAVLVQEDEHQIKRIVAYVVPETGSATSIDELRDELSEVLPTYMRPSAFVVLDELPLTSNGKLDREALPPLDPALLAGESYVAPHSDIELRIAKIWRDFLGIEKVGTRDNFFDLGGHSLLMSQVRTRLNQELGRSVAMLDLFQYPTIDALARHLGGEGEQIASFEAARVRMNKRNRATDEDEAIAIISMAGRFPGAASVEKLWENLARGVESVRFFSAEELTAAGIPERHYTDPAYVPARGYLDDAELFDAPFFGYPPREAELIDPQQRLFLECAWEALERAGYDPERYRGLIGVYAGSSSNSYKQNISSHPELVKNLAVQAFISSDKDFLSTRVSYKLNLRGPSVTLQTACSTSLVAIHEACKSLRENECDIALAGGVTASVPRVHGYTYWEGGIQSPDGHCRAFSADAKGMVDGEGIGIVALKRLSEAKRDGDVIHALIRGSAINNDGSNKVGYTAPSVEGQAEVIALAHAAAGVSPDSIGYIETHGTGTKLGDPIEIAALARVFGERSKIKSGSCALGAIKTNIGHLDAAAGVAGVIKTALALKHGKIPPSLHFTEPNPEIDFDSGPFFVNTRLNAWETQSGIPRRAGVSSFGVGGTNAHAVLEQSPAPEKSGPGRQWQLLPVSAKNEAATDVYADRIADYLEHNQDSNLADVSFTLRNGRRQFEYRRAVICKDHDTAIAGLRGEAAGQSWSNGEVRNSPPVVFMFPGQGSQYAGMAQGLYESETVFREIVDDCCEQLRRHVDVDLRDMIFTRSGDDAEAVDERLRQTLPAQCALFVIEYALARLWMSWGIQPAAMIGHSIGEYVAACISGAIDLGQALELIASRGRAMEQAPPGAMISVALSEQQVIRYLNEGLWLSVVNGHSICVISGTPEAVDELEQRLKSDEVGCSRLNTSGAFHSGLMDEVVPRLVGVASQLSISPPAIPYISNVTGTWADISQLENPEYWGQHLRNTVRFAEGLDLLLEKFDSGIFLEVGPGKSLGSMLRQSASNMDAEVEILNSLRHPREQQADGETLARALAGLWLRGVNIEWQAYDRHSRRCRLELPTYPFQRQSYWIELAAHRADKSATPARKALADWFYIPVWKTSMPLKPKAMNEPGGKWLVFCDGAGVFEAIRQWLRAADCEAIYVFAGDSYLRHENGDFTIQPGNVNDYLSLVESLKQNARLPNHVIHLWAITAGPDGDDLPEYGRDSLSMCYHSLIYLTQALGRIGSTDAIDINVISNHTHTVLTGDKSCPEKSTLLGPCAVIGQEHANLSCRNIEIEVSQPHDNVEALMAEIRHTTDDMVVAYRNGQRWVRDYESVRLDAAQREDLPIRPGGTYLITGGLGGIGLAIANYLAREFQARLVLTARSELPPRESWPGWIAGENSAAGTTSERIESVLALEALGARVMVLQADVVDKTRMQEVIDLTRREFGEINGVIHSAGLPGGRAIQLQSAETAAAVMAPKIEGTRVVGDLCGSMPLDFIVFCSSLASVLGVAGQVDYCSANAFQDACGYYYSARSGVPVISINWDTWNESGMAVRAREEQGGDKSDLGGTGYNHSEGIEAFKRILARATVPQIAVSTSALASRMPARVVDVHSEPIDETAAGSSAASPAATVVKPQRTSSRRTAAVSKNEPESEMEIIIANIWEELLGIDDIEKDDMFLDLGGHSLLALTMVNRFAEETSIQIPPVDLMSQTLRQLAASAEASQQDSG